MKENKVISDIEQLKPEWLTKIFKKKGYFNQGEVKKILSKKSEITVTSNMHYLDLKFSDDAQTVPANPNIAVRLPKHWDYNKYIGRHEAEFYNIAAENKNQISIPICYEAASSEETGWSHIILENLSQTHVEIEPVQGSGWTPPPSKRYCEKAIDCLSEIHAFWWDHPEINEISKHAFTFYHFKENSFNDKDYTLVSGSPNYENKPKNRELKEFLKFVEPRISNKRKEFLDSLISLFPQVAYERIKKGNITLIHSDAHLGNFFYPNDMASEKSKAILFDWQTWGLGAGCQDLAYMIGLCFYPDYRYLVEKDLIKRYHINLLNLGIEDYSWDDCWYDYRLFSLLNIFRVIWWWSFNVPLPFCWNRLECAISNVEDLKCIGLLEG
jgi:hypothetical protein